MNWDKDKIIATDIQIYGSEHCIPSTCSSRKIIYYTDNTAIEISNEKVSYYKLTSPYSAKVPLINYIKVLHRIDGPAIEYRNNDYTWYKDGLKHRDNTIKASSKESDLLRWYKNGKLHREDGPALITDFKYEWYKDGQLHRKDNPAIIEFTKSDTNNNTNEFWYKNGKLHREDGPAIIYFSGHMEWYINGKHHREGGPAIIKSNGRVEWYEYGKLHKIDGPAVIIKGDENIIEFWVDGVLNMIHNLTTNTKLYYINGNLNREHDKPSFVNDDKLIWYKNNKIHRDGGPAIIKNKGKYKAWYQNNMLHCEDGPAIKSTNGDYEYYYQGLRHRIDGPAYVVDNKQIWYVRSERIKYGWIKYNMGLLKKYKYEK